MRWQDQSGMSIVESLLSFALVVVVMASASQYFISSKKLANEGASELSSYHMIELVAERLKRDLQYRSDRETMCENDCPAFSFNRRDSVWYRIFFPLPFH